MDRRQFFRNSALISGAALSSGVLKAESFFADGGSPVEKYLAFIGAEMLNDGVDDCLKSVSEVRSKELRQVGYSQKGKAYALDGLKNVTAFRYELLSGGSECIDTCLLFFEKDNTGKWIYSATLTGFHLDALASAIENQSRIGRMPHRDSFIPAAQNGR